MRGGYSVAGIAPGANGFCRATFDLKCASRITGEGGVNGRFIGDSPLMVWRDCRGAAGAAGGANHRVLSGKRRLLLFRNR